MRGCGRPAYARGLCQTHHRQHLELGRTRAIRPYRPRAANTVKFAGLRLTPRCAATLERYASSKGLARGAAIAELLEQWVTRRKRRRR